MVMCYFFEDFCSTSMETNHWHLKNGLDSSDVIAIFKELHCIHLDFILSSRI